MSQGLAVSRPSRIELCNAVRYGRANWRYTKDGFEEPNLCCLGFVLYLLRRCRFDVPVSGVDFADYGKWMWRVRNSKYALYDIVLLNRDHELHCGVMVDAGQFVDLTEAGVIIHPLYEQQQNLLGVYRLHDHVAILPKSV